MGYTYYSIAHIIIMCLMDVFLPIGQDRTMSSYLFVYITILSRIGYPLSTLGFNIKPNVLIFIEIFTYIATMFLFLYRYFELKFELNIIGIILVTVIKLIYIFLLKLDENRYIYTYEDDEDYIIDNE